MLFDGSEVAISNISIIPRSVRVYNFDVLDNENYYVGEDGILVHNGYGENKAKVTEVNEPTHSVEISISKSDYPETAKHIEDAIASGKPNILEIQRDAAKSNRAKSLKGIGTKAGFDRDEYPMAMFKEGGTNASTRYITPSDNRGAGSAIGNALSDYPNGTKVKIIITD